MKKFLEVVLKLPAFVLYILFLILLGVFFFAFPRLAYLIGTVYIYGLYIFFGLLAVFLLIGTLKKWI
jgi:hypothetical protein